MGYGDGRAKPFERSLTVLSLFITVATGSDPGSLAADFISAGLPSRSGGYNIISTLYEVVDVRVCCEGKPKQTVTVIRTRKEVVLSIERNYGS